MTLAMVSLAGIPPLAGFFGKFLLIKSVVAGIPAHHGYLWLTLVALFGVVVSLYYYFGVIQCMYWGRHGQERESIAVGWPIKLSLAVCIVGMVVIGMYPEPVIAIAQGAGLVLR